MPPNGRGYDLPRPLTLEWLAYRYLELSSRISSLETENDKYDPAVQDVLLKGLKNEVGALKRAFYGLMFVIVGSSVTFAFTVFALLGR